MHINSVFSSIYDVTMPVMMFCTPEFS